MVGKLKVLAAGLLTSVLAAPLVALATPAAQADGIPPLRIGSYNIRLGVAPQDFRTAVQSQLPKVDILAMQEIAGREKGEVMAAMAGQGFGLCRMKPGEQTPILYRTSVLSAVSCTHYKIADTVNLGSEFPQDPQIPAQYATVLRAVHVPTGRPVSFVNVHLRQGAVKAGKPWPNRPRTYRLYTTEVRNLAAVTKAETAYGTVFTLGDFNAGFEKDKQYRVKALPYATFKRMGRVSNYEVNRPSSYGSKGASLYDQVFTTQRAQWSYVDFRNRISDHYPVVAYYSLSS